MFLTGQANGDCLTEVVDAGNYIIFIYHDDRIGKALPIFLIPNPQDSEQSKKTEGVIDRVNMAAANILKVIHKTVTKDAQAQMVEENRNTLLNTNSCVGCNLEGARLSGADWSRADWRNADLSGVIMNGVILSITDFNGATWCHGSCVCAEGSFESCNGCAAIEEVCTRSIALIFYMILVLIIPTKILLDKRGAVQALHKPINWHL